MNYLHRHHTHATPKPKPALSGVYITNNPRLNEVRLNRLNRRAQAVRIPITVREFWQRFADPIFDGIYATIILGVGLAFFYFAYIVLA